MAADGELQLWVGGSRAADFPESLRQHGIRAKMCAAGTYGKDGYVIHEIPSVTELESCAANWVYKEGTRSR
eukprot:11843720-Alexandrium_andersonii.AAC.1